MGPIDIIILIVVFLSVAFAIYRGLVNELLSISGWILAAFGALYSYLPAQNMLSPRLIKDAYMAGIVGSATVALLILVIMTLVGAKISRHLRSSPLSGLDRFLGFLFGIFRAFLLMGSVYLIGNTLVFSSDQTTQWHKENRLLGLVEQSSELLKKLIPSSIHQEMESPQHNETPVVKENKVPQPKSQPKTSPKTGKTAPEKAYSNKARGELDSLIQSIEKQ